MNHRFLSLAVASHLAVIAAGLWFGRPSGGEATRPPDEPQAVSIKRPVRPRAAVSTPPEAFQSTGAWSTREFAGAWKALGRAPLTKPERTAIRRNMLQNWAARDLASALEAALGRQWNDEPGEDALRETLFEAFYGPFITHPQEVWDLVASGRFGIDTGLLRHFWIETAGDKDPLFLAARIGDLPAESRQEALNACSADINDDGVREAALKILSKLPKGVLTEKQLEAFAEK
ncbi:hypothetical protein JIN84_20645 [Luteolibacter yonseiensis]|uniref:Uncharacterized protein n=1 Tax=Luteolibacter yonseiensis TaxID=1144680 RepID=A0A934RAK3_9BACT|nr:hypothetical protein [Luteolibacter yonseiensis]MBK1818044.1 hypothetical protein [Luteolibacter yonseiensis]